jgi:diguanylate cyclase (GGDEF)-like protein
MQDYRSGFPDAGTSTEFAASGQAVGFSLALLQFTNLRGSRAHEMDAELVLDVARAMRRGLREADVLFRYSGVELVALIGHTNFDMATHVGQRIVETIQELSQSSRGRELSGLRVTIGIATAPNDGANVDNLIAAARNRALPLDDFNLGPASIH